jgi:8-oxo-dGTP pyrophosphatase MutT (NUDIX family)
VGVEVRAAGGLVWRRGTDGAIEIVVVHRPRYDDWTLPKGKCDRDEPDEACALREVREETGLECRLGGELPSASYRDSKGRPKRVRYWAMEPAGGALQASAETDDARWLPVAEARELLSYERDRDLVESFEVPV